jgi:peptide/nickel transport system permease protein
VIGAKPARTLLVHILPNILTPLTVQFSLALASAVLLESGLSYLGLGTQPPDASWGTLLNEGRVFLARAPWMSAFPGAVIAIAVFCFFLLGDGLRDRLDPRRPR